MAIVLVLLTDHLDAFFSQKNASETNATNKNSVKLKNARVLAPPMLSNIELQRQCQPLTFQPMPESSGP